MSLEDYRRKRDFQRTSEPFGDVGEAQDANFATRRFVVQKHHSRRLHYDLRLELDGVLKSWAIPKGPSLDPKQKRLAVEVEDHPLEYGEFEGTIPEGSYGAGTVIVWDHGRWQLDEDGQDPFAAGIIKFSLFGQKLRGRWMLVRLAKSEGDASTNWLLVKERDEYARPHRQYDVLASEPKSVISDRTLLQIAANPPAVWDSSAKQATIAKIQPVTLERLANARRCEMPDTMAPQLATTTPQLPVGANWLHEIKLDGYRMLCFVRDREVILRTRNAANWTGKFPKIAAAAGQLPLHTAILDGEIVALRADGVSDFQLLQSASQRPTTSLVYFVFDLLYLDGFDLRPCSLVDRKRILAELLVDQKGPLQYLDHLEGDGEEFSRQCALLGLEGVISKQSQKPYRSRRSQEWRKTKFRREADLVVGGYAPIKGSVGGLGALVLGYFDSGGQLCYAGRVGSGIGDEQADALLGSLRDHRRDTCPFHAEDVGEMLGSNSDIWTDPVMVVRVGFAEWTAGGRLRQPTYLGYRQDVSAETITATELGRGPRSRRTSAVPRAPTKQRRLASAEVEQLAHINLTHPQRILFPDSQSTKLDLARYFVEVSPWMLPQVTNRALSLVRCPDGVEGERFFQKHPGATGLDHLAVKQSNPGGDQAGSEVLCVKDLAGLASLAQVNAVELHVGNTRIDRPEHPDRIVFDLDPGPEVAWPQVVAGAIRLHDELHSLGLVTFVKTSGSKGLHLVVPITRRHPWKLAKRFSAAVARRLAADAPETFTASSVRELRTCRIYIDFQRNSLGATTVAAYSPRARADAAISLPITWDELQTLTGPHEITLANVRQWLPPNRDDPWSNMARTRQSLSAKVRRSMQL